MNRKTVMHLVLSLIVALLWSCSQVSSPEMEVETTYEAKALTSVSSFGSNPGNLAMYKYAPANMPANAPLVVALHGCSQDAATYASDTGWNTLADKWKFYVVYAQQSSSNNQTKCFNFFEPGDLARGSGEAASIKSMVDKMKADYSIDNARVFVTGLSAGGVMTSVMLATYPDVFAGGGIMAGMPYKCATSMTEGFSCMSPGKDKTPAEWGNLVRSAYSSYSGPYPLVSIWHGSNDSTVKPLNATELVDQWTNVHGIDQVADIDENFMGYPHKVYKNASGKALVEYYNITGMAHAIAVDPGTGEGQGGTTNSYSADKNIYSSYWAGKFWGLDNSDKVAPVVNLTAPVNGSTVSGTVTLTASASDDVQVVKVEFYVDGVKIAEDTTAPYSASWNSANYTNGSHNIMVKAYDSANVGIDDDTVVTVTGGLVDTAAPSVNITSPQAGSEVYEIFTISATATDNFGVTRVEFFVDGILKCTDTEAPYSCDYNATGEAEGTTHALKAVAFDAAGNFGTDNDTSVTVAPFQCKTFTAVNSAHVAAGRAEYFTQYTMQYAKTIGSGEDLGQSTQYYDATSTVSETSAGYFVKGNCPVNPDPDPDPDPSDTTAPVVSITAPANNASLAAGNITISASASDNVGVTKVEFYAGSSKVGEDTSAPYSVTWNAAAGSYALTAKAYDAAGNLASSAVVNVTITQAGFVCREWTTSNYSHVTQGRATTNYVYVYTKGSNESLGLYNTYTTSTVKETAPGYFEKGSCN